MHAAEPYVRALASLGALAFTEGDFVKARAQYGFALTLQGLPAKRLDRYRHAYRVAATAVAARSGNETQARAIIKDREDKGSTPDEVTVSTAIKQMRSYETALASIDDCLVKRWFGEVGRSRRRFPAQRTDHGRGAALGF
jgi:hypothetical protein